MKPLSISQMANDSRVIVMGTRYCDENTSCTLLYPIPTHTSLVLWLRLPWLLVGFDWYHILVRPSSSCIIGLE